MNRRSWLGGVSSSFAVGTAGASWPAGSEAPCWRTIPGPGLVGPPTAQQGEDLVVRSLCEHLELALRTYLDIGANDPVIGSNTYLPYLDGARGVLVEPNPLHCRRLARSGRGIRYSRWGSVPGKRPRRITI